ncbi:MAG: PqqD family peptide modification chaperone [Candidatus Altiarchaeales archaeon]|nr:PqqD family peptide modification chaperone [Candidatus Altiarchaeales archaeon]
MPTFNNNRKMPVPLRKGEKEGEVNEQTLLLVNPSGRKYKVNKTTYLLWSLCDGERGVSELVEKITCDLDLSPNQLKAYPPLVECTLQQLEAAGLVEFLGELDAVEKQLDSTFQ